MILATHPWADPDEGPLAAVRAVGAGVALPHPGEPFEPTAETVPSEPWWRGVALAPKGGPPAAEALAGAGIKTASDAAAVAQADTVSDDGHRADKGTEDPKTLPAGRPGTYVRPTARAGEREAPRPSPSLCDRF
ncbi:hypothetical protein [Streptomyces hawaiiensis]|uniref:hypothetical protein n=1 Tax=Streptomyces hawaiiensis TaxID=67305 RepID=UPI00319E3545